MRTVDRQALFAAVVIWVSTLALATHAWAVPAFARKYRTACTTCHTVFPHLNTFGEAFRNSGYRFPKGADEDMTKEDPIPLGNEAYKKVFPKAVWPDHIPGTVPLSVILESEITYDRDRQFEPISMADVGNHADFVVGGTFDDTLSFFGEIGFDPGSINIERAILDVMHFLGKDGPNLKFGRFDPTLWAFDVKRKMAHGDPNRFLVEVPVNGVGGAGVGSNSFSFDDPQPQGLELWGLIGRDTYYNAGLLEAYQTALPAPGVSPNNTPHIFAWENSLPGGADPSTFPDGVFGPANNSKSVYVHASHKFIGRRSEGYHMDGSQAYVPEKGEKPHSARPESNLFGDHQSFTLGGFFFKGSTLYSNGATTTTLANGLTVPDANLVTQFDDYRVFGLDAQLMHNHFLWNAAYERQNHDHPDTVAALAGGAVQPVVGNPALSRGANVWLAMVTYAWHPWLYLELRSEGFAPDVHGPLGAPGGDAADLAIHKIIPGFYFLPRANLKVTVEPGFISREVDHTGYRLAEGVMNVAYGF